MTGRRGTTRGAPKRSRGPVRAGITDPAKRSPSNRRLSLGGESALVASNLLRRARLPRRLPHPRRRPRPHRRTARPPARDGRGGGRHRGCRGLRGRPVHARGGGDRAEHHDVRHGPPVRDRGRRGALEGLGGRARHQGAAVRGPRDAHGGVLRPRGGPLQGPGQAPQGGREGRRSDRGREQRQGVGSAEVAGRPGQDAEDRLGPRGREGARRAGRRPPAAAPARAREARPRARPGRRDRRRGGHRVLRHLVREEGLVARRRAGRRRQADLDRAAARAAPAG